MKKILLFLYTIFFTTNVLATGIGANDATAPCDNDTLGQTSGTANIEVDWQPNTIGIRWYDGDTQLTVQSSAQSCVYDDDLYLPSTQPTKTGYTFKGWTIKEVKTDFSTLPTNGNALEFRAVQINRYYCWYWTTPNSEPDSNHTCTSDYAHLQPYEWEVVFDWGTIYGQSVCSSTAGSFGQPGNPTESWSDASVWCKVTGYKPSGSNMIHTPNNNMAWVYSNTIGNPNRACTWHNALDCAEYTIYYENFRKALFGITQ